MHVPVAFVAVTVSNGYDLPVTKAVTAGFGSETAAGIQKVWSIRIDVTRGFGLNQ